MTALSYFYYSKTEDGWICPICREDDPKLKGGTVAHGAFNLDKIHVDGRKHPSHLICIMPYSNRCPVCRAYTDATEFRWVFENWTPKPANQVMIGLACAIVGAATRKYALILIGMALQANVTHRAIQVQKDLPIDYVYKVAHRIVRVWRDAATLGAVYSAIKCLSTNSPSRLTR